MGRGRAYTRPGLEVGVGVSRGRAYTWVALLRSVSKIDACRNSVKGGLSLRVRARVEVRVRVRVRVRVITCNLLAAWLGLGLGLR